MKTKLFILILLYFCAFASIGQTDSLAKKKHLIAQKWQIGVNFNSVEPITEAGFMYSVSQPSLFNDATTHRESRSFSFGIFGSYSPENKDYFFRILARSVQYRIYERYDSRESMPLASSPYILDTGRVRQSVFSICPSINWQMRFKKVTFFGGFQLVYRNYSSMKLDLRYSFYEKSNDSLTLNKNYEIEERGGYSIGLGPIVGFSVNLSKAFAISAEFSTNYSFYDIGGYTRLVETRTYPVAFVAGTEESKGSYKAFKFSTILSSLGFQYNF